jgi:hypothetical protein
MQLFRKKDENNLLTIYSLVFFIRNNLEKKIDHFYKKHLLNLFFIK